jgi:protein-disulfide isomerase
MNFRHPTRTASFLAALALLPGIAFGCGGQNDEGARPFMQPPPAQPDADLVDLAELGYDEGDDATAAFGVVEFSDFGCVFCAGFHEESYPVLHEEFVQSGDVLWKYIPITIAGFPNADVAAVTAICAAEQSLFAQMRDHLFQRREEWMVPETEGGLFLGYARDVGLDPGALEACLEGGEALATLERNNEMARRLGVSGTPTFVIAGFPVRGAPPLEAFQETLRELVVEARSFEATPPVPN